MGYVYAETECHRLFISGGKSAEGTLSELVASQLKPRLSMDEARYAHCLTVLDNRFLLSSGGLSKGTVDALQSCEKYDIFKDTWESMASMRTCRASHATVVQHGVVYVFGGFANGVHLDVIERFTGVDWQVVST